MATKTAAAKKTAPAKKTKSKSFHYRDESRIASSFDRLMVFEFNTLESHREQIDLSLKKAVRDSERRYERERAKSVDPDQGGFLEFLGEEHHELAEALPRLQWNAQFLVAFATFELCLSELCRIIEHKLELPISYKDLQGMGIEQCRTYLFKFGKVEAAIPKKVWQDAWEMKALRNSLAHANGETVYLPSDGKHITSKLKRWKGVSLTYKEVGRGTRILLTSEFVKFAIETFREVTVAICNAPLPTKAAQK